MNKNIAEGKWNELKGAIKAKWGKLTDDELDQTEGNVDRIAGKLQKLYGYKLEDARDKVNQSIKDFDKRQ